MVLAFIKQLRGEMYANILCGFGPEAGYTKVCQPTSPSDIDIKNVTHTFLTNVHYEVMFDDVSDKNRVALENALATANIKYDVRSTLGG